jgi:hypothetical protein
MTALLAITPYTFTPKIGGSIRCAGIFLQDYTVSQQITPNLNNDSHENLGT